MNAPNFDAVVVPVAPSMPLLVGIGASAGGLEALKQLLPTLPTGSNVAYVVLQHLAPSHRSMMADILSRRTTMPVREAHDGDPPEGGAMLVCPPNAHMEFDGARLRLTQPDPQSLPRPSINLFFSSLAITLGPRAVGIVLSGTGTDGALGLRQLRTAGGHVIVQQPRSARYTGMPEAALHEVGADAATTPEQIGDAIERILQGLPAQVELLPMPVVDEGLLGELLGMLRRRCGIDFTDYKEATLLRRIGRRLQARGLNALDQYVQLCVNEPGELDQLAHDSLISVTSFWRDTEAFRTLTAVLGERLAQAPAGEPLRAWVAGCATGEEAFSVAMAFAEALGERLAERTLQIFATDLDQEALAIARRGLYPPASVAELPDELLQRYFNQVGAHYEFSRALRERVVFSRHDVTRDPPFPRLDLVTCRNVLIYLKQDAQARVMRAFHYALKPSGLLFLGRSESMLHHEAYFAPLNKTERVYERLQTAVGLPYVGPAPLVQAPASPQRVAPTDAELSLLREAAQHYLPPCVLLDERLQVIQIHGDVGAFLTLQPGTQTFDLIALARPGVAAELRLLCALLPDQNQPRHADVFVGRGRERQAWRIALHPYGGGPSRRRALLAFIRMATRKRMPEGAGDTVSPAGQAELADARERLRVLVEQLESSNEEMQALNEEAQATNEELQSSNEELEAANEQMQATNQELATVNAELNHQWRRYQQLSEELQSVQNSIDLPLLVIDEQQAIRRYNDAAARLFQLRAGCEGVHVSSLVQAAGLPDLATYVARAQASLQPQVLALPTTKDGREYVLHLAHNLVGGERRGMVLTLVDNTELARAERHTRRVEERLLKVLGHGGALVAIKDSSGRYEFANDRYCRFFDLQPGTLAGRTDQQCMPPQVATLLRDGEIEALREGEPVEREETLAVPGGAKTWWVSRFALYDDAGAVSAVCVQAVDLTRWQVQETNRRLATLLFDHSGKGMMVTDAQHRILHVNAAFTHITGYAAEMAVGKTPRLLASGRHDKIFYASMWREIDAVGAWQGEIWNKRRSGEIYPQWLTVNAVRDLRGQVSHYVGVFSDVTALTTLREQTALLATHDGLTGLPNRSLLQDRLRHALDTAGRSRAEVALCFVDLDNFKNVNDSLGHDAGDEMLRLAARRISENVRSADTVARVGGDEFVLLLEGTTRHECLQTVERIVRALGETFTLRDKVLTSAASVGIAIYPADARDDAELMRNADAAMYRAKRSGRGRYEFFSSEVGESARSRLQVESELRKAVAHHDLQLYYQPQLQPVTGALAGVEALLRWPHASGDWIPPGMFLPIAEETSLVESIGDWVLDTACAQLAQWRRQGLTELTMAVNIAPRQLRDGHFADKLQGHLLRHRVPGDKLVLEITESAVLQPTEQLSQLLQRLERLGVGLSLDDFGTGYSSLARLRHLPLDELKIDASFVGGMVDSRDDREIVTAILAMARALGLRVVAEGVETAEQLQALAKGEAPPLVQGFLLGEPMDAANFDQWRLQRPARP